MNLAKTGLALAAVLATLALSPVAHADSSYDGRWSVRVVADNGRCNDDYALPIKVNDGVVTYGGLLGIQAGKVTDAGKLTIRAAGVRATGSLDDDGGKGRWTSKNCKGSWVARKA